MDLYFKKYTRVKGYTIMKMIGQGAFGIAYLAKNNKGEKVVVKQLKQEKLENGLRKTLFYEEEILNELKDSRFPKFITRFNDRLREGYILEYIEGKVVKELITKDKHVFSKAEIYSFADELIELIEILQEKGIVHRDIRLPNTVIKKSGKLALIDFGLARYVDDNRYSEQDDYWYLGDYLLHLYYSPYVATHIENRPWYEELDLNEVEIIFLNRLLGIDRKYESIEEVKKQLKKVRAYTANQYMAMYAMY